MRCGSSHSPGGPAALLKYAGTDATSIFEALHAPGTLDELPRERILGEVDGQVRVLEETAPASAADGEAPTLNQCINLDDFEVAASKLLSAKGWAYYRSAADSSLTLEHNLSSFNHVRFRPRVLVDVLRCDTTATILGKRYSAPVFISPAAMGKLAHPDGEVALVKAAGEAGMLYIVSSNASCSVEELAAARRPDQTLWWQLYVNRDRAKTAQILDRVRKLGYEAIVVTVDAPIPGKRELDERQSLMSGAPSSASVAFGAIPANDAGQHAASGPVGRATGAYIDPSLSWRDIAWIKKQSGLPVVVKGIQTAEDAQLCVDAGCAAIILSNHGGRQLEGAPSGLETLLEIRRHKPDVLSRIEVYLDGGVRRGTDVAKALCLGAKAVGLGRPPLYSLVFGQAGVSKMLGIIKSELETAMTLLGVTSLDQFGPQHINAKRLDAFTCDSLSKL